MPTFYVRTQVLVNNCGAHANDGRFSSGNAHWEFWNQEEYLISGVEHVEDAIAFVTAIAVNDLSCKEYVIHHETVPACYVTVDEAAQSWCNGEIEFPAKRINVQEYFATRQEAA